MGQSASQCAKRSNMRSRTSSRPTSPRIGLNKRHGGVPERSNGAVLKISTAPGDVTAERAAIPSSRAGLRSGPLDEESLLWVTASMIVLHILDGQIVERPWQEFGRGSGRSCVALLLVASADAQPLGRDAQLPQHVCTVILPCSNLHHMPGLSSRGVGRLPFAVRPTGRAVTAQGHPRAIFSRVIEHGNLVVAEATAREVGNLSWRRRYGSCSRRGRPEREPPASPGRASGR